MNIMNEANKVSMQGEHVPKQITINLAKKDIPNSSRLTGKTQMMHLISNNHVTVNLDADTWHKLPDIYWQMLAFTASLRFTDEDLGSAWLVEVGK